MLKFRCSKFLIFFLFFLMKNSINLFSFELFQFSVAPKYALQYGQMNEYVLYSNGNTQSMLNWEIDRINLLGFNATMGWELLFLETNCMWGFPKSSGTMCDSDWLNTQNYGMKTNYSESENNLDYLGNVELRFGLNIRPVSFLSIKPYFGISYDRIEFSADGGTYWYGARSNTGLSEHVSYSDSRAKTGSFSSYGTVIKYKRETFTYNIGSKVGVKFLTRFLVTADFGISIYSAINSVDEHILTKKSYLDKMQGFFKTYYLGAEVDVGIWKGLSAGSSLKFVKINQLTGNDYSRKSTSKQYALDNTVLAASGGYYYNIEFFVRYSF